MVNRLSSYFPKYGHSATETYKRIDCNSDMMQQSTCLTIKPVAVNNFDCISMDQASGLMMVAPTKSYSFLLV